MPSLANAKKDDLEFVPVWKQEVCPRLTHLCSSE